mgnify:FL=1
MKETFKKYLFDKNILVNDGAEEKDEELESLLCTALMAKYGYNVVSGAELMSKPVLNYVAEQIRYIARPTAPFYNGFPESVKKLCPEERLFDQLWSYYKTYGLGDFSEEQHSVCESPVERIALLKSFTTKNVKILNERDAEKELKNLLQGLCDQTRPMSEYQFSVLVEAIREYDMFMFEFASANTAIKVLLETRDLRYAAKYSAPLELSHFPKIVEELNYKVYHNKNIKKLNLKNQDRKFLINVLKILITNSYNDFNLISEYQMAVCAEKRAIWKGILYHLHYKDDRLSFIYSSKVSSGMSEFEWLMERENTYGAASILKYQKGTSAVLRHLDYIVSRTKEFSEIENVLGLIKSGLNPIILMQLIQHYSDYNRKPNEARSFSFNKFNMKRSHKETGEEVERSKSHLDELEVKYLKDYFTKAFYELMSKKKAGKVYLEDGMKDIAMPLDMATANGGVGCLPTGSRMTIPNGAIVRAFTYWEKVNDVDLSCWLVDKDFNNIKEFNWSEWNEIRNYRHYHTNWDLNAVNFSGDQTSGYNGGSEYFDIDIDNVLKTYSTSRYMIFFNNVFSGVKFKDVFCRAGYMLRDKFNSGEVYEPKTVQTAFNITSDSTFCALFAIDLQTREMIWLNQNVYSNARCSFAVYNSWVKKYLNLAQYLNVYKLFENVGERVSDPKECVSEDDYIITKEPIDTNFDTKANIITAYTTEKIMSFIEGKK